MALRLVFLFMASLMAPLLPAWAAEVDACNPLKYSECLRISDAYRTALPPFPEDPDRAALLFKKGVVGLAEQCDASDAEACWRLLHAFEYLPEPAAPDMVVAMMDTVRNATERGCDAGQAESCYWRGQFYRNRFVLEQLQSGDAAVDRAALGKDIRFWQKRLQEAAVAEAGVLDLGCAAGDRVACARAADLKEEYGLLPRRDPAVIDALLAGCGEPDAQACDDARWAILPLGATKPDREAELAIRQVGPARLRAFCEEGNGPACMAVGDLVDREARMPWLERACILEQGEGCLQYGQKLYSQYRWGEDAPVEVLTRATEALTKACDGSEAFACHMLEHLSGQ